jgi:hypothetical protein
MIKVIVKNLQSLVVASADFISQELAEQWVQSQTANQSVCLWGGLGYSETVPVLDENGEQVFDEVMEQIFNVDGEPVLDPQGEPIFEPKMFARFTEINHPQEFTVEYLDISAEVQMEGAKQAYKAAKSFGEEMVATFSIENSAMGITAQESMTLLSVLGGVLTALSNGYLETAIARVKALNPQDFDGVYITEARLLLYINDIENYLGITPSESL